VASVKNFQSVAAIDPSRPGAPVDQDAVLLQFDITATVANFYTTSWILSKFGNEPRGTAMQSYR